MEKKLKLTDFSNRNPPGVNSRRIAQIIAKAGAQGTTAPKIMEATGLSNTTTRNHLRNALKTKKVVGGFDDAKGPGRCQTYVTPEHIGAFRAAHGLPPKAGFEPKKPNLPPRAESIATVTKAQKRNSTVSRERLAVERVLIQTATEHPNGLQVKQIAELAGLGLDQVRKVLQYLRNDTKVISTGHNTQTRCYAASKSLLASTQDAPQPSVTPDTRPHCNSTMGEIKPDRKIPKGCALPGQTDYIVPRMTCPREDGTKHEALQSRRGDTFVDHTRPIHICSSVQGGMK